MISMEKAHVKTAKLSLIDVIVISAVLFLIVFFIYGQLVYFISPLPEGVEQPILDYIPFWSAGKLASDGQAALVYDRIAVLEVEKSVIHSLTQENYLPWLNPPTFLIVMQGLAYFRFSISFLIWSLSTVALFLGLAWKLFPNRYAFLAVFFIPSFIFTLQVGQSSFLISFLIVSGLLLSDRNPIPAGILIGLLAIKPQFAVLIPVALVASRNWRTFVSAAITVCIFISISIAFYGVSLWGDFITNTMQHSSIVLSKTDYQEYYLQSLYGLFLYFHWPVKVGLIVQNGLSIVLLGVVYCVWGSSRFTQTEKISVLLLSTLMFQSYSLLYDYLLLYFVIMFLVGLPPYLKRDWTRLSIIVITSILCILIMFRQGPGGFPLCLILLGMIILPKFKETISRYVR